MILQFKETDYFWFNKTSHGLWKITGIILLQVYSVAMCAQQTPLQVFYRQNWQLVNPASEDRWFFMRKNPDHNWNLSTGGRLQWAGFENAPITAFCSIEAVPVHNEPYDNVHWGALVLFDKTDAFSRSTVSGNFCYHFQLPFSENFLYLAIQPKINLLNIDRSALLPENPDDAILNSLDKSRIGFDAGFGAWMRHKKTWFAGISSPSLFLLAKKATSNKLGFLDGNRPQIDLTYGRYFRLGDDAALDPFWELNTWLRYYPGLHFKQVYGVSPISADINTRFYVPEKWWVGTGIGTNGLASCELGWVRIFENPKFAGVPTKILRLGLSLSYPVWNSAARLGSGAGLELTATYGWRDY